MTRPRALLPRAPQHGFYINVERMNEIRFVLTLRPLLTGGREGDGNELFLSYKYGPGRLICKAR